MAADDDLKVSFAEPGSSKSANRTENKKRTKKKKEKKKTKAPAKAVFLPGKPLEEDEELVCDKSVYHLYQVMETGSPCLSFDVLQDNLGNARKNYPMTAYIVAGTQAEHKFENRLLVLKMSNMTQTTESLKEKEDDEESSDSDSSSDEDDEDNADLGAVSAKLKSAVNRVRATKAGGKSLAATWLENGEVSIWDVSESVRKLENYDDEGYNEELSGFSPVFSFKGHLSEGYAVDWSPTVPGRLLTGDCKNRIHFWKPEENMGGWNVDQRPFQGHEASVEDIQWSPTEATVFSSCSVDKTVRVWDVRAPPHKSCMITVKDAHASDVNVISWNKSDPFIVSGGDDGVLNVWDLREVQTQPTPVASFKHHMSQVTTVEWNPNDSSVFASGGADDQIAFWDIAMEADAQKDPAAASNGKEDADGDAVMDEEVPPQLLFIHQGQKDIKELHWHPQIPGVVISTALSGFNIFKPISV